jgi:hypothetical protein
MAEWPVSCHYVLLDHYHSVSPVKDCSRLLRYETFTITSPHGD